MPPRQRMLPPRIVPPMPMRLAEDLEPDATLDRVPGDALGSGGVPYHGEEREEQCSPNPQTLANSAQRALCQLRRAWRVVGFMVDPGSLAGEGATLVAQLRIYVRGGHKALTQQTWTITPGGPVAIVGIQVGARCELVVTNPSGGQVTNVAGAIWGMNEGIER